MAAPDKAALERLFNPATVAIVGASARPGSSGGAVLSNMIASGYGGRIVPVHPKAETVMGLRACPSVSAIEGPVDLAVIVVRPDLINAVVAEAAEAGVRQFLILPGGYSEAGEAGRAREAALRGIATRHDLCIMGPNCAGLIDARPGAPFAATFLRDLTPGGGVALISQSGAIAEEAICYANENGVPLGTVVSVGNGLQLGVGEYLDYLGDREDIRAILLYIESVADETAFEQIARRVTRRKPVVALIGGRTGAGAAAAARHTGAASLDADAAVSFAARCGMIRVASLREMMSAAMGFGFFPAGIGRRVLLVSNSGGPGVITTDRLIDEGLEMPALPAALTAELRSLLPPEAAIANPMDLLADAREDRFAATMKAVLSSPGSPYDAVLSLHVVPFMVDAGPVVAQLAEIAAEARLPMMHTMMGTLEHREAWFAELRAAGVPVFRDGEQMAQAAGLLARFRPA